MSDTPGKLAETIKVAQTITDPEAAKNAQAASDAKATSYAKATKNTHAILNMLGLAARSRRIVTGADAVITAVRSKAKPHIAAVASDASDRTHKQLADKCSFNGVPLITLDATRAELAAAVGKKNAQCSACAVTDRNMAKKIDILYHG